MARHHNITGELTTVLLAAGSNTLVSSISLCNVHADTKCTVDVYIEKQKFGKFYLLKTIELPVGVTLLDENISFDNSIGEFGLFIKLTKSASETPSVDVILM
jgi:hypothetical protein